MSRLLFSVFFAFIFFSLIAFFIKSFILYVLTILFFITLLLLFLYHLYKKYYSQKESYGDKDKKNIIGTSLEKCSCGKQTGWLRDGYCSNNENDTGTHIVCAKVTDDFLRFTKTKGNDLSTPTGGFPGLVEGDCWCLCISRWLEAYKEGVAPQVFLEKTDNSALKYVDRHILEKHAVK